MLLLTWHICNDTNSTSILTVCHGEISVTGIEANFDDTRVRHTHADQGPGEAGEGKKHCLSRAVGKGHADGLKYVVT